jgi:1-deoxy-D-xylulose-5-phosphate reductoisomerase
MARKRVTVLGSTGSVGMQALDVIAQHPDRLEVASLAAGSNYELLADQVKMWKPSVVSLATKSSANALRNLPDGDSPEVVWGDDGLILATTGADTDVVLNAVVGAAGLAATHAALSRGIDVALANKESLVMAGELVMATAQTNTATVLPVDSEPNALHQCLRVTEAAEVRRLVLTASGGPFLGWSFNDLGHVTPEHALEHPTWKMGPRITIDSATLMNKGFEIIETHWFFGVPTENIEVVIHPQSIVHSLIELVDGSMIAYAGPTDMRLPIQDALSYPERWTHSVEPLDLVSSAPWTFEQAEPELYPALALARQALEMGGTAPAILNAVDEIAVAAFLEGQLTFARIIPFVAEVLEGCNITDADDIETILEADATARSEAKRHLGE